MAYWFRILFLLSFGLLVGCSGEPSERDIREAYETRWGDSFEIHGLEKLGCMKNGIYDDTYAIYECNIDTQSRYKGVSGMQVGHDQSCVKIYNTGSEWKIMTTHC